MFLSEHFPSNQPLPLACLESPNAQALLSSTKQMMAAASKLGTYKCYLLGVVNCKILTSEMFKNDMRAEIQVHSRVGVIEQRWVTLEN